VTAITDLRELIVLRILRFAGLLRLNRIVQFGGSTCYFADFFKGFENVDAVRGIFGEKTGEILRNLKVQFTWFGGYMFVDGQDGHIVISSRYLNNGDKIDIYLDLIHELVHVRQFMEGKQLFDSHYGYTDRPTEVEAYRYAVQEARNLGLSDERICLYLKTEWVSDEDFKRLAKHVDIKC